MTKIEKGLIVGICLCVLVMGISLYSLSKSIESAGGVKGIIVSIGKEVKDISEEISRD